MISTEEYNEIGRLHAVWKSMHSRCRVHPNYAGRVTVEPEWATFAPFAEWCIANGSAAGLELDRTNNEGNYGPDNCRWVTSSVNMRNTRKSIYLTARGETKHLLEWLEDPRVTIGLGAVRRRLKAGWDHERALFTDLWPRRKECKRGHPLVGDNVRQVSAGRVCVICLRNRDAANHRAARLRKVAA